MSILFEILILAAGFLFLVKGSDYFVDGAASLATRLGISQLVIGLTIVAMGTSAPEAAVSISAAFRGSADITIANILGSNILNILIILGLASAITNIRVAKETLRVDIPFMIGISVVLLLMGLTGEIGRIFALILIVIFALYLGYLFVGAKKDKKNMEAEEISEGMPLGKAILFTLVGLAVIILGSQMAVKSAEALALYMGLSERFIGLTVVALGTSLPELFTSVSAARKGNADIAIGNIVGSNIFNILFVVGISGLIIPVPFQPQFIFDALVAILAAVLLFLSSLKLKLGRTAGILMLLSYAVYFTIIF